MATDPTKLEHVFDAARALSWFDRGKFLDEACGEDAEMRTSVESLLRAHDDAASHFLETQAMQSEVAPAAPVVLEGPGTTVGRYKLLQQIGEGGMAVVFLAEQTHPIQRKVALKIIKPGMDSRQVTARFEAERQALALMEHENIAKVYDAGTTPSGRPFFVMEPVNGVPITSYCDRHRLSPRQRLELFVQVCAAVQHAHQKGIIHRDIKPSNVLVVHHDGKPIPKVIDFGIAKATGQQLTERTLFTGLGALVGTPEYMSPEQAELNQPDIDTRSDIYSLGVMLYELLTGTTPLEHKRLKEVALLEILRFIREEEPPKPSTRLTTTSELANIAAQRGLDPKHLARQVHGELDWIVMKALEKERSRRYETANGFATDIQRYLHDEPVQACPPSATYRLRKFARRHRGAFLAASLAVGGLLLMVAGLAVSNVMIARQRNQTAAAQKLAEARLVKETEARASAVAEAAKAKAISDLLQGMLESARPNPKAGPEYTVRQLLDDFSVGLSDKLKDQPDAELAIRITILNAYRALGLPKPAKPHGEAALELRRRLYGADHPLVADSLMDYAWIVRMDGDPVAAERHARDALAIYHRQQGNPKMMLSAYSGLLQFLIKQSKYVEADAIGQEAIAFARKHGLEGEIAGILQALSTVKRVTGSAAEAAKLSAEALELARRVNKSATAYTLLEHAANLNVLRKFDEAEPLLREALAKLRESNFDEAHPSVLDIKRTLLSVLRNRGDTAGVAALRKDLIVSLRKALEAQPDNAKLRTELGDSLNTTGDVDGAIVEYSAASRAWDEAAAAATRPSDVSEYRFSQASVEYQFGLLLAGSGRAAEAEKAYQKSIAILQGISEKQPQQLKYRLELGRSRNWLGLLLRNNGRADEAERQHRQAIEIYTEVVDRIQRQLVQTQGRQAESFRRELAWSHMNLGNVLTGMKQTAEAESEYRSALVLTEALAGQPSADPMYRSWSRDCLLRLGHLYAAGNRPDEAIESFSKVIELESVDGWVARGEFYLRQGDFAKAEADFNKVIELEPKRSEGWTGRAFSRFHRQQWEKAIADFSNAIELDPRVHTNWLHRGHTHLAQSQWDRAAADFTKLVEQWPQDSQGWFFRAVCHAQMGQRNDALSDLNQAVAKGFNDLEHLKAESRLDPLREDPEFKKLLSQLEAKRQQ